MKKKVVVGMSGGVDSSVSALLLKEAGFEVIGFFMRNWHENVNGVCTAEQDYEDVARVCEKIDIPYYAVDFSEEYQERVFKDFLKAYQEGFTPNPDVLCNREIKFNVFFKKALDLGADFFATGHYAQTQNGYLFTAADTNKDQTYFLHLVRANILEKVLFPLGSLKKQQVREIAQKAKLKVATKKDSTGICFIGKRKFREFLSQYLPSKPGPVINLEGQTIGEHHGVCFYTIGQRKGFKIFSHKGSDPEPWFIIHKNAVHNTITVAQGANHPALFKSSLHVKDIHWIKELPSLPAQFQAKCRYRQVAQPCEVFLESHQTLLVRFHQPQRAITPGQSIVFYDQQKVMGGGIIFESF